MRVSVQSPVHSAYEHRICRARGAMSSQRFEGHLDIIMGHLRSNFQSLLDNLNSRQTW